MANINMRVQRQRTKGWRKPEGSVVVDRTSRWGNPYKIEDYGRTEALRLFREALEAGQLSYSVDDVRRELSGKTLVCFCDLTQSCHADVLLEVANQK